MELLVQDIRLQTSGQESLYFFVTETRSRSFWGILGIHELCARKGIEHHSDLKKLCCHRHRKRFAAGKLWERGSDEAKVWGAERFRVL